MTVSTSNKSPLHSLFLSLPLSIASCPTCFYFSVFVHTFLLPLRSCLYSAWHPLLHFLVFFLSPCPSSLLPLIIITQSGTLFVISRLPSLLPSLLLYPTLSCRFSSSLFIIIPSKFLHLAFSLTSTATLFHSSPSPRGTPGVDGLSSHLLSPRRYLASTLLI